MTSCTKDTDIQDAVPQDLLTQASDQLDAFLPVALAEATGQLEKLTSPVFRSCITEAAVNRFIEDFVFVEEILNKAAALKAIFPRSAEEVKVLLT